MSDCQSPEALVLCQHGKAVKFGCSKCYFGEFDKPKEETITIKKALWDEMLEYKRKVDELEWQMKSPNPNLLSYFGDKFELNLLTSLIPDLQERIKKLENLGADVLQDFEKRMIKLESKILELDKICDAVCN